MLADLEPHQQVAAVVMRLGGAGREMVRGIIPQELAAGGAINGAQYGPVSYIDVGLQQRFARLDDENRLLAMTQLLAFQRRRGEGVNGVRPRSDVVRQRAAPAGNFIMSRESYTSQLVRACDVLPNMLIQFLLPTNGRLVRGNFFCLNEQLASARIPPRSFRRKCLLNELLCFVGAIFCFVRRRRHASARNQKHHGENGDGGGPSPHKKEYALKFHLRVS